MRDVQINHRGIGEWLRGPECRSLVEAKALAAQQLYRGIVAHRTGALAGSADVSVFMGGEKSDRWKARLTVGDSLAYGAAHEYGTKSQNAARDLNQVLTMLAVG